jgi:hypothetical protein
LKKAKHKLLKKNVASTSIVKQTQGPPMSDMPPLMDNTSKGQNLEKVSTIKAFLQSRGKLLNDPSSVKVLQNLLER